MQARDHPDELTPREREVLDLLRIGLTNEEIATRLGISLDGAKYHVSQILSKLGVTTREEAAAAYEQVTHVAGAFQPRRRRWWAMLPLAAKLAGAAVVAAAVGGLGVLAWGVLTMSDHTEAGDRVVDGAGPRIGDHWHAPYQFLACGEKQPNAAVWESGVHTHGDGIVHIHPYQEFEEGAGASLVKWFEYGGGLLTETEIRIPGFYDKTFRNGDLCPDGEPGELRVFVTRAGESTEERMQGDALEAYIPHDGDRIRIIFGQEDGPLVQQDRTEIPADQATRTIEIVVTDDGTEDSAQFKPGLIELRAGETAKILVRNEGTMSRVVRVAGDDGSFGSSDDFVSVPDIILPGDEGYVVVRFDEAGVVEFRDDTLVGVVSGVIVIAEGQ